MITGGVVGIYLLVMTMILWWKYVDRGELLLILGINAMIIHLLAMTIAYNRPWLAPALWRTIILLTLVPLFLHSIRFIQEWKAGIYYFGYGFKTLLQFELVTEYFFLVYGIILFVLFLVAKKLKKTQ